jgi:predicted helicase
VLPRLFGFEIMIAPYTIAHLKMSMLLKETGFKYFNNRRLGIYLTNSLEEGNTIGEMFDSFGLAESISEESKEASKIKKEKPIMVVLGNPPYSGESSNKGKNFEWIDSLLDDYKKEPGGLEKLNERNPKWLNDDYVRFLRFGQYFIERNKTGIVAFINAHGFLDNPTFRGMRWNLLKTYDKIYVLNLHGNAKKKEVCPDGSKDENVFDIQQGVSINIFVKTGEKKEDELGQVLYTDVWGIRSQKFEYLIEKDLEQIKWQRIKNKAPMYFMVPRNYELEEEYNKGFKIDEIFQVGSVGIQTGNDSRYIQDNKDVFNNLILNSQNYIQEVVYRPFDRKFLYYDETPKQNKDEILPASYRSRATVMQNMEKSNLALIIGRQGHVVGAMPWNLVFCSKSLVDLNIFYRGGGVVFPLYLYDENNNKNLNLRMNKVEEMEEITGSLDSEELFNYIYAVLHSNIYRKKYATFLKFDFPRIPYPKDKKTFNKLAKLGNELIKYHLLEHENIDPYKISYLGKGDNIVEKPEYKDGKVYINSTQYFGNVSEIAWNFYIGGYQPAQKWLKDRKGRELSPDDIEHYSKIVIVLKETDRIMKEIDKINF